MYAPQAAFFSELFGTSVRYTGASVGYQLASIFAGALAPIIALKLLGDVDDGNTTAVGIYVAIASVITVIVGAGRATRPGRPRCATTGWSRTPTSDPADPPEACEQLTRQKFLAGQREGGEHRVVRRPVGGRDQAAGRDRARVVRRSRRAVPTYPPASVSSSEPGTWSHGLAAP